MLSIWKLLMVFLLMVSVIDMLYNDKSGSSTHNKRGTFPAIRYFMHGFRKRCAKTSATVGDHHLMTLCFRQPLFDSQLTHWPCFSSMVCLTTRTMICYHLHQVEQELCASINWLIQTLIVPAIQCWCNSNFVWPYHKTTRYSDTSLRHLFSSTGLA